MSVKLTESHWNIAAFCFSTTGFEGVKSKIMPRVITTFDLVEIYYTNLRMIIHSCWRLKTILPVVQWHDM